MNRAIPTVSGLKFSLVIIISGHSKSGEAMEMLNAHRLLALPVVDSEGILLGIVDIQLYLEEAVDIAKARRSDGMSDVSGQDGSGRP